MLVRDVQHILEVWAPRETAWERDNVGLQVGDHEKRVRRILVALDVNDEVVSEAAKKKVDLVITHHPLLFRPPKSITPTDRVGKILLRLIQRDIALYAAHTNLDFTSGGVSFALAERLGLKNSTFLAARGKDLRKIAVFVPSEYVEKVAEAMASAGAGIIGKYDHCSFRLEGKGTFKGQEGSKPFVGEAGKVEEVNEVRLEMIVPMWKVEEVVRAMRDAHPYEEAAHDIYVLENENANYGAGAIGKLERAVSLRKFLRTVKEQLQVPALRFTGDPQQRIERVAVCGGSGSNLVAAAIRRKADVFVTADVKYHSFEAAQGKIALVDAGHFETEQPSLDVLIAHLQRHIDLKKEHVRVLKTSVNTNPVQYY